MTSVLILLSGFDPGTYFIEDDGIPNNGVAQLRGPDGTIIYFNIPTEFLTVTASAGRSVVFNLTESFGAADINVGSLTNASDNPDSITVATIRGAGDVLLVSNGSITELGSDAAADITATTAILSAATGVGSGGNAIETQLATLEAETNTGGINLSNLGAISVGGISADVNGLAVLTSGDLVLSATGSITLSDDTGFESVHGGDTSGSVTLIANGAGSDIVSNVDQDAIAAPGGSITLTAGRDVSMGTQGLNFDNDVRARNDLIINVGRDLNVDGFADLASDGFGAASGGDVIVNAGRDINLLNSTGTDGSIGAEGSASGDAIFNTGPGGFVRLLAGSTATMFSSTGDVTVNADRIAISASSGITASAGVTLRPRTEGWAIDLGSVTDGAFALELSDAELDRIFTSNATVGGTSAGAITVSAAVNPSIQSLELITGTDIYVGFGFSVLETLTLRAGDNLYHYGGTLVANTIAAEVDTAGSDGGAGGFGSLGAIAGATSISLSGNADGDVLRGAEGVDQAVHGYGGHDAIISSGEGHYYGDEGDDVFQSGLSSGLVPEVLDGGTGTDSLDTTNFTGSYNINLATGVTNFGFESFLNFENLTTGDGSDMLLGSGVANTIDSGSGTDTIYGFGGNDTLRGNLGNDTLNGGDGNDVLDGGDGADAMTGGIGDDSYTIDNVGDVIAETAGQGFDRLATSISYALTNSLDIELLETTNIDGGAFINLTGNDFANSIYGNAGSNILIGAGGGDYIVGGGGADTLDGGIGADALIGGAGDDLYLIDNNGDAMLETAGNGTDRLNSSISFSLAAGVDIEIMATTDAAGTGSINLTGNEIGNSIYGNAGANVLTGGGGADYLVGLGGNDVLNGGAGADAMEGGLGDDTYVIEDAGDIIAEAAASGFDTVRSGIGYALGAALEIEVLMTVNPAATATIDLTGNGIANSIYGNAGANWLSGGGGDDYLVGLAGADLLHGNADNDALDGGANNDTLDGGAGNDALFGGTGNDNFNFSAALNAATNADSILDFAIGQDRIQLDDFVFTGLASGALSAAAFRNGAAAADADDRIIYNQATGQMFFDADGNGGGAAVLFATASAGLALTATDFFVI